MEEIFNIDELIKVLKEYRNEVGENAEVYIKDTYSTGEYLRISCIRIDGEGDIIIEDDYHS